MRDVACERRGSGYGRERTCWVTRPVAAMAASSRIARQRHAGCGQQISLSQESLDASPEADRFMTQIRRPGI